MTAAALPEKVTAVLVDGNRETNIYRLHDARGYTRASDVIRVRRGVQSGTYAVDMMRATGWTPLLDGAAPTRDGSQIDYATAVRRAVAVLYGTEDHG